MAGIDNGLDFHPMHIAVLTVSDTRTMVDDTSGALLAARIEKAGHHLADRQIIRDQVPDIAAQVQGWIDDPTVDAVVTTGGTGLTGRDVTPEALRPLFDREIEGFSVIFHQVSYQSVGLSTLASRACAGVAKGTFLFLLPGSNGAVKDGWDKVIQPIIDSRHQPCNLYELKPRLLEA